MTRQNLLYFDCFSGIAGDMILASLIDMGLPIDVVEHAVSKLPLAGYRIETTKEKRNAIMATRFHVRVDTSTQPHRHYSGIRTMIEDSALDDGTKTRALAIFKTLAEAEAKIHGTTLEEVHFHEVGAVDSIVDIVGAAAGFNHLDAEVVCSPIPVGYGIIHTEHGNLPVPAPATLQILEGIPIEGTEIPCELTTPTGAAVIKATAKRFGRMPEMVPRGIGFGAGSRSHETRPGLLRVVMGEATVATNDEHNQPCIVVETNVDDMTGELAANAATRLLKEGALDVWFESIYMKKGRPAQKLAILCKNEDLDRLAGFLFEETSTIGLRYYPVGRMEMDRSLHLVETPFGNIHIKVARGLNGSANAAPEFEDCARAARAHSVSVKQVMAVAAGLGQQLIQK